MPLSTLLLLPIALSSGDSRTLSDFAWPLRVEDARIESEERDRAPGGAREAFLQAVDGARIVGLGEATHGTAEIARAKHALIRSLVLERDATALVLEISVGEGADLDDFVTGRRQDLDAVLGSLSTWMFQIEEFRELVEWIAEHNRTAAVPVRIHGMEAQYADRSTRHALSALARRDEAAANELRAFFGEERIATEQACAREFYFLYQTIPDDVFADHQTLFFELRRRLEEERTEWVAEEGALAFDAARQHVTALGQFLSLASLEDAGARAQLRDYVMFVNVQWVVRRLAPGERAIVWAHNEHVWKREGNGGYDVLGRQLARRWGSAYYALGFDFGQGAYRAPGASTWVHHVPAAAEGSLSAELAALGGPDLFLDIAGALNAAKLRDRLTAACRVAAHAGGYVPMRDGRLRTEQSISLADRYDGLWFVAETTATTPLVPRGSR